MAAAAEWIGGARIESPASGAHARGLDEGDVERR